MAEFIIRLVLDIALLVGIVFAIRYALRVEKQLNAIRSSRNEMERFVHDFGMTVARAEAGIKNLKNVARDAGDDLEKLIERANLMKDDLKFVYEQADTTAERITQQVGKLRTVGQNPLTSDNLQRAEYPRNFQGLAATTSGQARMGEADDISRDISRDAPADESGYASDQPAVRSRAEMELLRVIEKLR